MKMTRWIAILFAAAIIACCFFPWVHIESRNILIGGFYSDIDQFGKPGLLHCFFSGIVFLFLLVNKLWSLRAAFFSGVFNLAWALRNFFLIPACSGGECPVKLPAFYVLLIASVLVIILIPLINTRNVPDRG